MKKSIFSRYFYLGTIITFFFAALLGSLVLLWADGRYEDEKREQALAQIEREMEERAAPGKLQPVRQCGYPPDPLPVFLLCSDL